MSLENAEHGAVGVDRVQVVVVAGVTQRVVPLQDRRHAGGVVGDRVERLDAGARIEVVRLAGELADRLAGGVVVALPVAGGAVVDVLLVAGGAEVERAVVGDVDDGLRDRPSWNGDSAK